MRVAGLALLLAGLALGAAAAGEGDESQAVPNLLPTGGLLLFYETTGPLSFVTMTPKDRPADARSLGEVRGRSCQRGLSIPLSLQLRATSISAGYGDGSFHKAVENIKKDRPEIAGLWDVRTDLRVFSVLGVYRQLCTEVTARAFALPRS